MKMGLRIFLLIALAACFIVSCHALPKTTEAVVPETQFASVELVDQVRHLPASEIVNFLQSDDSQCRSVATALKAEVKTVIAADVTAYTALDTGAACPSSGQTEVDTAQTAANAAATELTNAQTAKTNAASAPVTMTVAFSATTPTVEQFTSTTQWQAAVATNNQAGTTVATKDGARRVAQTNLATAQGTQTTLVLRCQCKAKAAYTAAVASAKTHESSNKANWRKAEKLICALDATEPCPSNFPGHPTAPTLPNAVSSKTDNQCATNAPTGAPTPVPARAPAPGACTASSPCTGLYSFAKQNPTAPGVTWINTRAGEIGTDAWKLVRRVKRGSTWHPATDRMVGSDVYGDYDGWIGSDNTFSIKFVDMNCDRYLFANLEQHGSAYHIDSFMIFKKADLLQTYDGTSYNAPFVGSNNCAAPRTCAAKIKRTDDISTPWLADDIVHAGGPASTKTSYAENGVNSAAPNSVAKGYNVYCRIAN